MAHLETIQDRFHCIPCVQVLAYLKKGELSKLVRQGAGGALFAVDGSRWRPSSNILDEACAEQAEPMGFASIIVISERATALGNKRHNKGKGKKRIGAAVASMGLSV